MTTCPRCGKVLRRVNYEGEYGCWCGFRFYADIVQPSPQETRSKACSRCGQVKPLTAYNAHPNQHDGRRADCRECQNQRRQMERGKEVSVIP